MKSQDLKGKKVVSIKDGETLGQVDEVLVDTESLQIAALHIKGHGEAALIPFDAVRSADGDVITVPSSSAARRPSARDETSHLSGLNEVSKLKVVDEEGTFLGVVQSLEVDPKSGAITTFEAQKATVFGLGRASQTLAASEVTSVGEEMIVVQAPEPLSEESPDSFSLVKRSH